MAPVEVTAFQQEVCPGSARGFCLLTGSVSWLWSRLLPPDRKCILGPLEVSASRQEVFPGSARGFCLPTGSVSWLWSKCVLASVTSVLALSGNNRLSNSRCALR